jgi:dTDP-4-amino-4,6-dideoxygalactose transaminase
MEPLAAIAERHKLHLIGDAAEARRGDLGQAGPAVSASSEPSRISTPTKIITTGEGGMIDRHAPLGRLSAPSLRDHAFHRAAFLARICRLQLPDDQHAGRNRSRPDQRMNEIIAARRRLRGWYEERLRPLRGLERERGPGLPQRVLDVRHLHDAAGFGCGRDELRRRAGGRGIETRSFFVPMHVRRDIPGSVRDRHIPSPTALRIGTLTCRPTKATGRRWGHPARVADIHRLAAVDGLSATA